MHKTNDEKERFILQVGECYARGMSIEQIAERFETRKSIIKRAINLLATNYSATYVEAEAKRRKLLKESK